MESVVVAICCLIFLLIITVVFFTKPKINKLENKSFSWLLVLNMIGLILQILSYILINNYPNFQNTIYYIIIIRAIFCYYVLWELFFVYYITIISFSLNEQENRLKNIKKITIFFVIGLFIAIQTLILPIKITEINGLYYPTGSAMTFMAIGVLYGILIILYCIVKNYKHIIDIKYLPLLFYIIFGSISIMWQMSNPRLLLITPIESLVLFLMYFTIENPDMKLLTEMHEAKEISDNANEEKTLFLYNMTQEIRATTKNIDAEADIIIDSDNIARDKESARNIKGETSKFRMMTNDILDVSAIDSSKIKIYNTSYSIKMLLRTIISSYNEICKNKNIEFRTNIDHNIPESLYGDNINLKKVLKELLDYSVKSTSKGYIELNINTIIKNDIARLIITIEDSSMGLKSSVLERITIDNKVFSSVYKLITLMNGTMVITSNYGTGNKIKIILDQKIEPSISIEEKKYQSILDNKKILIIDNTESTIKVIEKLLKESNIDIDYSLNGKDAYNKIKTRNRYDLILLDEELSMMTGVELLNYLKKIRNFNIPVILLSKDNKYEYNEEYLNMGFTDILIKPIKKTSLLECINKNIINREDVLTKNKETK